MSELNTVEAKVGYGIGRQMGEQLASSGIEGLGLDQVVLGLREAYGGKESQLTDMELHEAFEVIQLLKQMIRKFRKIIRISK